MYARYLFICLLLLQAGSSRCIAQEADIRNVRQSLSLHKDSSQVDALNVLSLLYITREKKDSAKLYAALAYQKAHVLNYARGIAISLMHQSQIAKHFDDNFLQSERLGIEALKWFERASNKSGIDTLYNHLIYTLFAQGRFDEAEVFTQKQHHLALHQNDQTGVFSALGWMFAINRQKGDYEKSFEYEQQVYDLAVKSKDKIRIMHALYGMAQLYMLIEDYPQALSYFRQILQMDDEETRHERVVRDIDIWFKMEFTEVFSNLGQFDSAWHYYRLFKPAADKPAYERVYLVSTGECLYLQKQYKRALKHLEQGLAEHQKLADRNEIMRAALDLGKTHLAMNNNKEALRYGRWGLHMALETKARQYIRDGYQILSTVYDRLQRKDSANWYFRQYATMKDSVLNDQAKGKFAAYKFEQQIALISKEKEIQQARLRNETLLRRVLIAAVFFILVLGLIVLRNILLRRKNERQQLQHQLTLQAVEGERTKAMLQQQSTDLEMQALRAQMNPHFIFNSLNAINRFILKNDRYQASEYLTKFARLVRHILQNSQSPLISLESELDALRLYLELESLRFDNKFEYSVSTSRDLDVSAVKVPPLIIQPYAENAIWHGLMHKQERGHLSIEVYEQDLFLVCKITDDGVGRKKAAELKSKSASLHKSMGMQITASRINMMQENASTASAITITDLVLPDGASGGTEVLIQIPLLYD